MSYTLRPYKLNKYVLAYKYSQDHLEVFVSAIRSRGGHNNKTACQFERQLANLKARINAF